MWLLFVDPENRPCKVIDVSTSKTGKHGHAKCHFVASDIFNGKKMEELVPASHNCEAPFVHRADFSLVDVTDDGFVSLMDEGGNIRDDLKLPEGNDDNDKLARQIQEMFDDGKDIVITVLKAMTDEEVFAVKEASASKA